MSMGCRQWNGFAAVMVLVILQGSNRVMGSQQVPAMFVFGDSLMDDGNNNYLNSIAKSNYMPYGCDFSSGPSGRFCNGKTIVDFLGNFLLSRMSKLFLIGP